MPFKMLPNLRRDRYRRHMLLRTQRIAAGVIIAFLVSAMIHFHFEASQFYSLSYSGLRSNSVVDTKAPVAVVRETTTISPDESMTVNQATEAINDALQGEASEHKVPERHGVAIFGAGGNIGSQLMKDLMSQGIEVVGYDRDPKVPGLDVKQLASQGATRKDLERFEHVIFLGGCTQRRACEALSDEAVWKENVESVLHLALNMDTDQQLISASTSAVTEGSGYDFVKEDGPVHEQLLDTYSMSMYKRENELREFTRMNQGPDIVALRFGTVVGVSPGQRIDLAVPSLFTSAYATGVLQMVHGETMRSFLWLPDLTRAIGTIVKGHEKSQSAGDLRVFHLASFSASIQKIATSIAMRTGARIDAKDSSDPDQVGFSLDTSSFQKTFNFTFQGSLAAALDEFDANIPHSIEGKGAHSVQFLKIEDAPKEANHSVACPVCGSHHVHEVLDLHQQPFANDFRETASDALQSARFPLKLVRCTACNHMYLSQVADRGELFSDYLYRSATSVTLRKYFEWLAKKVVSESGLGEEEGSVLEIACNDGSQLNQFKALGWKTFGVDPAANLVPEAVAQGHEIMVGFWGGDLQFPALPAPPNLTAIVAQNVLAHVPKPVEFLRKCADAMGDQTRLYIQTSQCQMNELGQFDTAYHEHVSFFTGHSFQKAAELAGLYIANFELTPIHGTSCLVTFRRKSAVSNPDKLGQSIQRRLDDEVRIGLTSDFFYKKYNARATFIRTWISSQMGMLASEGFTIGAYGAAAKGMVLLHFLLAEEDNNIKIDFVIDDAPLKQNKFCPGTSIPVWPADKIREVETSKPLAIIVLAWNFWPEIASRLRRELKGQRKEVLVLLPFPEARLVRLTIDDEGSTEKSDGDDQVNGTEVVVDMPYYPTAIPNPLRAKGRRKTLLLTQFNNEELLLPYWIRHHAPMFDNVVLVDFESDDQSVEIIKRNAPDTWSIVPASSGGTLKAKVLDEQMMEIENNEYPEHWSLALTATEFLVHPRFREAMTKELTNKTKSTIFVGQSSMMIGDDSVPLERYKSLLEQRSVYMAGTSAMSQYNRWLHINTGSTHKYSVGRHRMAGPDIARPLPGGFVVKFQWTPWPNVASRKLNVGAHIHSGDKAKNWGRHHFAMESMGHLVNYREESLFNQTRYDFCEWGRNAVHNRSGTDKYFVNDKASDRFRIYHAATGRTCRVNLGK